MSKRKRAGTVVAFGAVFTSLACSSSNGTVTGTSDGGGQDVSVRDAGHVDASLGGCVPGAQTSCPCAGSSFTGVQVCAANGASYGSCAGCRSPEASTEDARVDVASTKDAATADAEDARDGSPTKDASVDGPEQDARADALVDSSRDATDAGCPGGDSLCSGACVDEQTDDANCGGCGLVCSTGCLAGRCLTVLASGTATTGTGMGMLQVSYGNVYDLAVDSTDVYFSSYTGDIARVPIGGGLARMLAQGQGSFGDSIAVDATNVYWASSTVAGAGAIAFVPKASIGGTPTTLASGAYSPSGIAADGTNVYFTGVVNATSSGFVDQVPVAGGTAVTLASGRDVPTGIVVSGPSVYWEDFGGGTLTSVPVGGGLVTTLTSSLLDAASLASDGTALFAVGASATFVPEIVSIALTGGAPVTLTTASGTQAYDVVATDGVNVYATATFGSSGVLLKLPVTGGPPILLATGLDGAHGVAVDSASVYVASGSSVLKLTPK